MPHIASALGQTPFARKGGPPRVTSETPVLDEPRKPELKLGWPLLSTVGVAQTPGPSEQI
jgi:hypothetical protein